jgi:hypothetical protein
VTAVGDGPARDRPHVCVLFNCSHNFFESPQLTEKENENEKNILTALLGEKKNLFEN